MSKYKKSVIWIIIILAVIAGGYFLLRLKKPVTVYVTAEVARGNLTQTVSVTGEAVAKNEARPSFQFSGEVGQLYFDVGDRVKKGDKLAQIKAGTQQAALSQAKSALEGQKRIYEDYKNKDDVYSREQRQAQKAVIRQYEAAVQEAKINLSRTIIYSPIDGIVTAKFYEMGEVATAGSPAFTIMGDDGLELRADVPESDIVKISLDQEAEVKFDSLSSNEKIKAVVVKIEPAATVVQDVVYYRVELEFANDPRIKPGMSADIDIRTAQKNNVVIIPLRAVKNEGEREYVEILKTKNKTEYVEKVDVKTGLRGDEGMVEVVSGLSGGEKAVTLIKNGK